MSYKPMLATCVASSIAVALLSGGTAMAEPILVLNDGATHDLIISRGEYRISVFSNELKIDPWPTPGGDPVNSLLLNFQYSVADPGTISGTIEGNNLPPFPSMPLQSPALAVFGGLRLEGSVLDGNTAFLPPVYDFDSDIVSPATLNHGTGPFADFNLESFSNVGDMAYIGYASSDLATFGYMQIERVTDIDWRLVGYAFDSSQDGLLVKNLIIPNGATLLTLCLGGASGLLRKRR